MPPGDSFTRLSRHLHIPFDEETTFWKAELQRLVQFWSANDPTLALDRIARDLTAIRAALRQQTVHQCGPAVRKR
jgi:hypothetical protein